MLLLKTSAHGCIKSSSCWRLNDVKDFISVLACGITQQLRLFGLWDFSKWRGSTCSSRNFSTGVCFLWRWWGCHVASGRQSGVLPSLNFFASLGEWNHLLSVKGSEGKEERFFFFFLSNKVLCSKLIDKILVWLCTCFKSLPKSLVSEVVCNRLKYIKVYFCVKLF